MALQIRKPVIMQHFLVSQINNGGPATGAKLLMNSHLKNRYHFIGLDQTYAPHGFNFKLLRDFYKKIKQAKPDVLHIRGLQSEGLYGVIAGKMAGCKKVLVSVHGIYSDQKNMNGVKRFLFARIIEPLTLRLADMVYCVSECASKRNIIKKNATHFYGFIHNAAPDYPAYNGDFERQKMRDELYLGQDDILITCVSRVTEDKGFITLSNCIKEIQNSNVKFLIAGDGSYMEKLKNDLSKEIALGKVILVGRTNNVRNILFASDIFVFPSLHENLSNALLEACAAALPCVATNVGGNPEIILDGKTGLLIEPNDTQALVTALGTFINSAHLRNEFGTAAKRRVDDWFGQKYIFEKIGEVYEFLLKK